ncbi:MAG TPA: DUF1961 family protein [Propionibacteriaceae bacterium]|nr:DUF1961 family protein [Propionibacteriaceae bacterium]
MELYRNPLAGFDDLDGFVVEGDAAVTFPQGRLRLESRRDPAEGQAANLVLWCPEAFPDGVEISWDFWPVREPGLAILFFGARGRGGESVLAPSLAPRNGPYEQYHSGDIDAYHVSYFRRMWESERRFHTCNLRKSHGFHLVAQGPDPLPGVLDSAPPYRVSVTLRGGRVTFSIDGLRCLEWVDDGALGPVLGQGHIGFRQMAPLIAEYANLTIRLMENPETT